jgi:hypothetical protein
VVRGAGLIILFSDLAVNAFLLQQLAHRLEEVDVQTPLLPQSIEGGYGIALIAIVPNELTDDGPVTLLNVGLIGLPQDRLPSQPWTNHPPGAHRVGNLRIRDVTDPLDTWAGFC